MSNQTYDQLVARLAEAETKISMLQGNPVAAPLTGNELTVELLKKDTKVLCAVSDDPSFNPLRPQMVAFVTAFNSYDAYPFVTQGAPYRYATALNTDGTVRVQEQTQVVLTGSALAKHMLANGQKNFRAKVSDTSDERAIERGNSSIVHVRSLSQSVRTFRTNDMSWDFAVPMDDNNQPKVLVLDAAPTTNTRPITGTELAKHLIATNQAPFRAYISDESDAHAIRSERIQTVDRLSMGSYTFNTNRSSYDYAVPVDSNNQPLVVHVPVSGTRQITGSELADHLIATGQVPFRAFTSDGSDRSAIGERDISTVIGLTTCSSYKYETDGCSWDFAVPVDRNDNPLTLTL